MNELIATLRQILLSLRLWVTVTPWEQAIRVRLGRSVKLLNAGVHFKIPLIDLIYLQSVRMRIAQLPRQTLETADGRVISLVCSIGYSIADIALLYKTLNHAEDTISNLAQAAIAAHISKSQCSACTPVAIQEALKNSLPLDQYGLSGVEIYVTECAVARTYRVLGDYSNYSWGSKLATDQMHDRSKQ